MPEIQHETIRSNKLIIGSEVAIFNEEGIATVSQEVYDTLKKDKLKGFILRPTPQDLEEEKKRLKELKRAEEIKKVFKAPKIGRR